MSGEFVERRNESFYLVGSRVPLAHIVREFQRGESAEAIRSHYPALSLEQVYGATTFYPGSQTDVEADIAEREREEDAFNVASTRWKATDGTLNGFRQYKAVQTAGEWQVEWRSSFF